MNIQRVTTVLASVFVASHAFPSRFQHVLAYADGPKFCRGLECPLYNKTGEGEGYEVRSYAASVWVSTNVMNLDYDAAMSTAFSRLFSYISGENEESRKIEMTAPVISRVIPGQGPACESNFTISFFVPFELQSNPPAPSRSDVIISHMPAQTRFVGSFGGFAKQTEWVAHADKLNQVLSSTSYRYSTDYFYTAGYDSPFQLFNRHNEVWFVEK